MTKRFLSLLAAFTLAVMIMAQPRAKYVFYFIGDGMGVNQVNGTTTYLAALEGRIGVAPLTFTGFPVVGLGNTQSATNGVTDSAAAGTALACGKKTKNGALGVAANLSDSVFSIAVKAKEAGLAVGVSTSVAINHATPAAFYAHVPRRNQYHQIGKDLIKAGFDFYAGADFLKNTDQADLQGSLDGQCEKAGYTLVRSYREYQKQRRNAAKMLLLQGGKPSHGDASCLPYAIDRTKSDLTLQQITRAGISFLTQADKAGKGFFLMVEGGKIDYACHSNDAATAFREVVDMDEAVRVAYEFYEQHPEETLIVITADHETGGIVLGRGPYELHLDLLKYQKMSAESYSRHLKQLFGKQAKVPAWEKVEADLKANWGFWQEVKLTDQQTDRLKKAYEALASGHDQGTTNLYASLDGLADAARMTMAECALVGWQSGGHSNGYVPVFAIGAGSEKFGGVMDNTLIPAKIAEAAGLDF